MLYDLGAAENDVILVRLGVEHFLGVARVNRHLPLGSRLPCQHRLVHNAGAGQQQHIRGNLHGFQETRKHTYPNTLI